MAKFANGVTLLILILGTFNFCHAGIEEMLSDPLFVRRQIDCVLERRPCDGYGKSLKASLGEVLGNDCRRCTPQQMVNALKIMQFMEKHHQDEWYEILLKYQANPEE